MVRRLFSRVAVWTLGIAGVLTMATPSAKAEFFEYSTSVVLSGPFTPATGTIVGNTFFTNVDGNSVTLNPLGSFPTIPRINGSAPGTDIPFTTIDTSSADASTVSTPVAFNYDFTLTISDYAGKLDVGAPLGTGVFHITGRLDGTMGNGQVNIDNLNFAVAPVSMLIGGAVYTVTVSNNGGTRPGGVVGPEPW
jgi:hypothetical protein